MCDVISSKVVTTRKNHQCVGCRGMIPAGRRVERQVVRDDVIYQCYTCEICQAVIDSWPYPKAFCEGWIIEECYESWSAAALEFEERTGTSHNSAIVPLTQHQ